MKKISILVLAVTLTLVVSGGVHNHLRVRNILKLNF